MDSKTTACAVAITALACAEPSQAHHSIALFDMSTHIWLTGTVVRYEPVNPHAIIELEERTGDGQVRRWVVEGPRLARLDRLGLEGDFVEIGDVIDVCGFFAREDISRNSRVHGHIVRRPDGQMWQWGPYGRLELCVAPDDWDSIATGSNPLRTNAR